MPLEILTCPNCSEKLIPSDNLFHCHNNHSFDVAKEGYLNLLLPNQKKSKLPGDSKEMIENREGFLSYGFYTPLAKKIQQKVEGHFDGGTPFGILDIGCGSGYYLRQLVGPDVHKIGIDISKFAISKAAKLDKDAQYIVSSYLRCPVATESIDVILNNFAPVDLSESIRILKSKGVLLKIVPYKNHMRQVAELIYTDFQPHSTDFVQRVENHPGLEIICSEELKYTRKITKEKAAQLIGMTPYYHTYKRLNRALPDFMDVTFSFLLIEVQKE